MLPETIGHYKILKKLGEGGMGEVYQAEDLTLGRSVALKILPEEFSSDPKRLRRFQLEARAASALNHPNATHIYEIGEDAGIHYIAMELVHGQTLQSRIEAGPVPMDHLLEIALQTAAALQEAHDRGIIHRDIKPSNIMIASGNVKVLDFGLARIESPDAVTNASTHPRTEPGAVFGTVHYMSPEQALGQPTDARSDIFSLGILLYESASGRRPFNGPTHGSVINQIVHAQPESIARLNSAVPAEFERMILKCLRKDPAERYQSVRELIADLRALKKGVPAPNATEYAQNAEYKLPRSLARTLFIALQIFYLTIYICAMRWNHGLEVGLMYALGKQTGQVMALVFLVTAMIGIAVRLYLLTTVMFDHLQTGIRYRLAFPFLFILDELWAASPLGLCLLIGEFPALACVAPLAFSPFSQRTLIRSAYDLYSARRISTSSDRL